MVTVIAVIQMFTLPFFGPQVLADPRMCILYVGTAFFIIWLAGLTHKDQRPKNPIKMFVFLTWWVVNNVFLTPLAFLTLDTGSWGNRDKVVESNSDVTVIGAKQ
jgi:FtsH-binding integral membrane protein